MRVLIVDDHELFRAGLALLLRELFPNIELLHASTLSQGLSHALGELMNIVFLDLDLPDGHGCNALAELKESRPSLPVIVISADESVETISRCIQLRAMGYVPKSSSPEALHAAISAVLAGGVFLPAASIARLRRDMGTDETPANEAEESTAGRQFGNEQRIRAGTHSERVRNLDVARARTSFQGDCPKNGARGHYGTEIRQPSARAFQSAAPYGTHRHAGG